jgi:hypothetical protein
MEREGGSEFRSGGMLKKLLGVRCRLVKIREQRAAKGGVGRFAGSS